MRTGPLIAASVLTIAGVSLTYASLKPNDMNTATSLDNLLSQLDGAIASADVEKMERLFLAPDASENGRNRESNLAELRKDWAGAASGPPVKFNPKRAVIHIDMDDLDPDGPPGGHISKIELKVIHTDDGWRIEEMRNVPKK